MGIPPEVAMCLNSNRLRNVVARILSLTNDDEKFKPKTDLIYSNPSHSIPENVPPQVAMIINVSMRPYEKKSVYNLMQERRRKAEKRKKQLGDSTLVGKGYYQDDEDFIDANSTLVPREVAEFVSARQRRELVSILQKHIEIQKNETAENKPVQNDNLVKTASDKKESKDRSREDGREPKEQEQKEQAKTAESQKAAALPQANTYADNNEKIYPEEKLFGNKESSLSQGSFTQKKYESKLLKRQAARQRKKAKKRGENNMSMDKPCENDLAVKSQNAATIPQDNTYTDNNEKIDPEERLFGNKESSLSQGN